MEKPENVSLTKTSDQQYRDVFICECYSTEHQLLVHYMIEGEERADVSDPNKITFPEEHDLNFEIHLTRYDSFWKRLWCGLKYAFGYKSRYGDWDNFKLRPEDADKLITYLTMLKKNHSEVQEYLNKDGVTKI